MLYDVFLSCSHAADGKLAPALQSRLQSFARPCTRLWSLCVFPDCPDCQAPTEFIVLEWGGRIERDQPELCVSCPSSNNRGCSPIPARRCFRTMVGRKDLSRDFSPPQPTGNVHHGIVSRRSLGFLSATAPQPTGQQRRTASSRSR
jgi:hypothetical protein